MISDYERVVMEDAMRLFWRVYDDGLQSLEDCVRQAVIHAIVSVESDMY